MEPESSSSSSVLDLQHGFLQKVLNPEYASHPGAQPQHYYFAYIRKSTGVAVLVRENDSDIEWFGPYVYQTAAATVYDVSLILHRNTAFTGNYRMLSRCALALVERADIPIVDDPAFKIIYTTFLLDAAATFLQTGNLEHWKEFRKIAFFSNGKDRRKAFDVENHWQQLEELIPQLLRAYDENTWPDGVWTDFLRDLGLKIKNARHRPPALRILVGKKPIDAHLHTALPDVPILDFMNDFSRDLCKYMEKHFCMAMEPGNSTSFFLLAKLLVYVLGRHMDSIPALHRPVLFSRFAGHLVDAIIENITHQKTTEYLSLMQKPRLLENSPKCALEGLEGTHHAGEFEEAMEEIVEAYNNRQWPLDVWQPLLDYVRNGYNILPLEGKHFHPLRDVYSNSQRGSGYRQMPVGEGGLLRGDKIHDYGGCEEAAEEEEEEYCFRKPWWCVNCMGPSRVCYRLRWRCRAEHRGGAPGEEKKSSGPYGILGGDCARRIHNEVMQIFPFATAFTSTVTDPLLLPPAFVEEACHNFDHYRSINRHPSE